MTKKDGAKKKVTKKKVTREEIDRFISLRNSGKTKTEISKLTDRSIYCISSSLYKEGFTKEDLDDSWRKDLLKRLVEPEKKDRYNTKFWILQSNELNTLMCEFPNIDFWKNIKVRKPLKTLYYFKYDTHKKWLKQKYAEFNYNPKKSGKDYQIGDKSGESLNIKKKINNTRSFLNG